MPAYRGRHGLRQLPPEVKAILEREYDANGGQILKIALIALMTWNKHDLNIKRTNSDDPEFQLLISHLDNELWNELHEDQATYDQFNQVRGVQTASLCI